MKHLTFLLIAFLTLQTSRLRAQFITIQNGIEWIDDDGKVVRWTSVCFNKNYSWIQRLTSALALRQPS